MHKLGMHTAHSTLGPSPSSDNASAQGTPPVRDTTPLIVFIPSLTLDEVTQPLERCELFHTKIQKRVTVDRRWKKLVCAMHLGGQHTQQ